ncbi:MAG: phosphoribosylamine--glycine ligase [Bacteroidales bacterium]|nr:phosphoribosylamine--glycine ligase [Bacteroidales bacterium]
MNKTNVLLIGSGGREHAIAWKLAQSPLLNQLFIAPGNAGTTAVGTNVAISGIDFEGIKQFVLENQVDLVIVGPEDPLVRGIHDYFLNDSLLENIPVIGPQKAGAELEGSKDFAKQFMIRHGIPTGAYKTFTKATLTEGIQFLKTLNPPYVLKADGLAAGKGVLICKTLEDAEIELTDMLANQRFGKASEMVVIEEFLDGIELSAFAITNGSEYLVLPEAKDYKRIGVGDTGPNTGGMGSISPVPFAGKEFMQKVEDRVIRPTVEGLRKDGIPYQGFLFFGLMNVKGDPFVIEYNVRLGDPETESLLPRIKNDLLEIFLATAHGGLSEIILETDQRTAACVMIVSGGYPGDYIKGKVITGMETVNKSLVFHAGTSSEDNNIISSGGRVIAVTTLADDLNSAIFQSLESASQIKFGNSYFRNDIGKDLM